MEENSIKKWNDKHFQICLALIARNGNGNMSQLNFADIINKADRMVQLLKEREQNKSK